MSLAVSLARRRLNGGASLFEDQSSLAYHVIIMDTVYLAFLGLPDLRRGDQPLRLVRAKGMALLLYLAVTRVAQPRERVLDLLWPESLPQAARKNMRNTLWAIREALGDDILDLDGASLRLATTVMIDVHRLEDALLLLEGGTLTGLEAAVTLYRGPLADGLVVQDAPEFEVWLTTERERIAAAYVRLLERIIALDRDEGHWQAVLDHAQRGIVVEPLRESLHLASIEAYVRLGLRSQAGQQYTMLADILKRELDVTPLPATTARYEALLADGQPAVVMPVLTRSFSYETVAPFVGRESELALLAEAYARAAQGVARVALISGDLGMGKTRLWRAWGATLPAATVVLATHALETVQAVPYGPLRALFRQPGPARALLQPPSPLAPIWLSELTRLLPEIAATWQALPAPLSAAPPEERARLFQALIEALRVLAQPLLVLIIDDLHWADPSTLDWLVYVVDQLQHAPLLVIGTYRQPEANTQLTAAITGWQRQGRLHQIPLAQLTADEGHMLLDTLGVNRDATVRHYWVQQSGGNPYFLLELSRAPAAAPPGDLAALILARVRTTVPPSAYQVLQAAAILGDYTDLAVLHATSGRSEEETLDALDALVAAGILAEQGGAYSFVHPLIATVVARDLTQARRIFLHRRAAHALEQASVPHLDPAVGALMEHWAAAGEIERAAHYADRAAAQALNISAFTEAATFARRALEWAATPQRDLCLAETLMIAGATAEAHAHTQQALYGFQQRNDVVGTTRALALLAQMAIAAHQPDVAGVWLQQVPHAAAAAADSALSVRVRLLAAGIARQRQAYADATTELDHADRLISKHQPGIEAAQSAFERGNLLANQGQLRTAIAAYTKSLRIAQALANPVQQTMAHNNLAYHFLLLADLDAAQQHAQAGMMLAERYALGSLWQYLHSTAGEIALALGRFEAADAAFVHALDAATASNNRVQMANVKVNQALVARARNDVERARALLDEAQAIFRGAVDPFVHDKIVRYRAELMEQNDVRL